MAVKTAGQRKTKGILIRVTVAQKRSLAKTAKRAGLGLSSWMLSVALQAAQNPRPEDGGRVDRTLDGNRTRVRDVKGRGPNR